VTVTWSLEGNVIANHPLLGNVMGILTSWDPDTPEGLESQLSVRIRRIMAELPHSTELDLRKLCWTRMDSSRASMLELLWGLPISQEFLRPSERRLSLYSTKIEFGSPLEGGINLTFFTPSVRRSTWVFTGVLSQCFGWKWGLGATCQVGRPARVAGRPCFMAAPTLGIGHHMHRPSLTRWQSGIWIGANTWPTDQGGGPGRPHFGRLGPGFMPHHPLMSYSLWLCLILDILKICMDFWYIWCFSVIWCSWKGRSTKLVELVSNNHLSSVSWMKCRYVGGKYMHFMTANTSPPTHTHT
jgi:hypothetical protein